MDGDPLAGMLGEKAEHDDSAYHRKNNLADDSRADPEMLAPDLLATCKANDTVRAQDFLADGVPPGYSDPESGWSCLHWAVYNGNPVLTRALVRAGAASGYKRASATLTQARKACKHNPRRAPASSLPISDTPLHWSAYRGDLGITWILLKEGYSPNDTDHLGNTATHLAAANGHERVLDTLIRDGADVHRQNKFKNTPYDVANLAECRSLLRNAEAMQAPSAEEVESMHAKNLQRVLEAERVLVEAVGPLEPTDKEQRQCQLQHQQEQDQQGQRKGQGEDNYKNGDGEEEGVRGESKNSQHSGIGAGEGVSGVGGRNTSDDDDIAVTKSETGEVEKDDKASQRQEAGGNKASSEDKGGDDRRGGGDHKKGKEGEEAADAMSTERAEGNESGGGDDQVAMVKGRAGGNDVKEGVSGSAGDGGGGEEGVSRNDEEKGDLLAQVEKIREAVAGAEALCICEDLVAAAKQMIEGLLLQNSIEKQSARVTAAGPVLTQEAYTTLVNRLMLLLRRAEGNTRITKKLKGRAKALVDKSHAEYWLQVAAQRLLKVECAETRHIADMAKLETCIDKAAKAGAQLELASNCRSLLKRLKTEVEISKAIESFPTVRLPMEVMPKDYWQPEDNGHIEETEGFPLPPVDIEGKNLEYVWVASQSLKALSAACKRMSDALVGGEGLNPALVARGSKKLNEFQKELKALQEKDTTDRDKAVAIATKAAKKLKKKKGGGKKKKK